MPDILVNRNLVKANIPEWRVNDDNGKRIGVVDQTARQNFIHILGDMTSPVGGLYAQAGSPTLSNLTQRIVRFTAASGSTLLSRGKLELFVAPTERYVIEFTVGSPAAAASAITMTHGSSYTLGIGPILPTVNNIVITDYNSVSPRNTEISVTFASNPSALTIAATLFWYPASTPPPGVATGFYQDNPPIFGWAAQTGSPGYTLSLSTNNGTNCYTFACISSHSASQTSFV